MANLCSDCLANCQSDCNTCNGNCQNSKQKVSKENGKFYFRAKEKELKKDSLFLSAKEWNDLIDYIESGYELAKDIDKSIDPDSVNTFQEQKLRAGKEHGNEFMLAHMWNGAYLKMKWLSKGTNKFTDEDDNLKEKQGGPTGDIIYAEYFNALQDYANNDFKTKYCDSCNNCQICNKETNYWCCSCVNDETSEGE